MSGMISSHHPLAMDATHLLFLGTLDDIEAKLQAPTVYNLTRLSALLRQLLLDGVPLIDRVNREYHLRIRFEVTDKLPNERALLWMEGDGIAPDPAIPGWRSKLVKRDELLARRVAKVGPDLFTVRDVIDQVAHVAGGVHAGSPDTEIIANLTAACRYVQIFGAPMAIGLLPPIARVVVRGLADLRAAVLARASQAARDR